MLLVWRFIIPVSQVTPQCDLCEHSKSDLSLFSNNSFMEDLILLILNFFTHLKCSNPH